MHFNEKRTAFLFKPDCKLKDSLFEVSSQTLLASTYLIIECNWVFPSSQLLPHHYLCPAYKSAENSVSGTDRMTKLLSKMLLTDLCLKNITVFGKYIIRYLILVHFLCLVKLQTSAEKVVVLLSDEVDNTSNISFHLSRPKDIIAGGCLAAHHINKFQDSFLCHFKLHPILVSPSDPVKGVPKLLDILLDPAIEVIGVTGAISNKIEEFYRPLVTHFDERIPQKYANSYLPSLEDTANAVIQLLQQLNWTKVTIIQSNDYRYDKVANHIRTAANTTFKFVAINEYTIAPTIQKLKYGETKIFLILAPPHISSSVIHKAIEEDVVWPHYVWVVILLEPASLTLSPMWENVLLIMYKSPALDYSNTTCTGNVSSTSNFYSSLLYNAVWQVLMANESLFNSSIEVSAKSSDMSHRSISDCIQSNDTKLNRTLLLLVLFVVRNQGLLELGYYRATDSSTELVNVIDFPTDQLPLRSKKLPRLLLISLCAITFITYVLAISNFILMIAFRKENEVKASSFVLTIVIYIGSCLLLCSTTLAVVSFVTRIQNKYQSHFICIAEVCSFTTGLSVLLLTYILKTLRIWRIFSHFGKMSAAWSDSRLLVVVLIGSAVILILSIVFAYDLKYDIIRYFRNDTAPPYYEYTSGCFLNITSFSRLMFIIASSIEKTFLVILFVSLLILSWKTRNLRRSDFKETKRINFFIMTFTLVYFSLVTLSSFVDFQRLYMPVITSLLAFSFFAQLIIFPPIFFPIFYRRVVKQHCCSSCQRS